MESLKEKTAEEWLKIENAPDVFNNDKPYGYEETLAFIAEIQQDARNAALREAAEVVKNYANAMRGAHVNTNDSCGTIKRAILALIKS